MQNHPDALDPSLDATSLNVTSPGSGVHALPPLEVDGEDDLFAARLVRQAVEVLEPAGLVVVGRGRSERAAAAARAAARVTGKEALHASWADVAEGRLPREARGLALLFDSLSDPLGVLREVTAQGFEVLDVLAQSAAFGRHVSEPGTLRALRGLRRSGLSWFADVETMLGHAPHAYLTLGVIARRGSEAAAAGERVEAVLKQTLADYQTFGPAILPRQGFVSLLRSQRRIAV